MDSTYPELLRQGCTQYAPELLQDLTHTVMAWPRKTAAIATSEPKAISRRRAPFWLSVRDTVPRYADNFTLNDTG